METDAQKGNSEWTKLVGSREVARKIDGSSRRQMEMPLLSVVGVETLLKRCVNQVSTRVTAMGLEIVRGLLSQHYIRSRSPPLVS